MDAGLVVAVVPAVAFAVTNGLHGAANSIAVVATPIQAVALAAVFNLLGPLFLGAAVANRSRFPSASVRCVLAAWPVRRAGLPASSRSMRASPTTPAICRRLRSRSKPVKG